MSDYLATLEEDPRFRGLSYDAQRRLRAKAFIKQFQNNEQFQNLDQEAQQRLLSKYVNKIPQFESPRVAEWVEGISNKYKAEETRDEAITALKQTGLPTGLARGSAIVSAVLSVGNWLSKTLGLETEESQLLAESLVGKDAKKAQGYFSQLASNDYKNLKTYQTLRSVGEITGFVGDIAATIGNTSTVGFTRMAQMAMKGPSLGAFKVAGNVGKWVVGKGIPKVAEVTLEGLAAVARERIYSAVHGEEQLSFGEAFSKWAAIDYLVELGIAAAAPFAKGVFRVFTKGGRAINKILKETNSLDITEAMGKLTAGKIPHELEVQLSDVTRDELHFKRSLIRAHEDLDAAWKDPFKRSQLAAAELGVTVVEDGAGGYRLRRTEEIQNKLAKAKDKSTVNLDAHETFSNTTDLKRALGNIAKEKMEYMKGDALEGFKKRHQWLLNLSETSDEINKLYNPVGEAKEVGGKTRFIPENARGAINPAEASADLSKFKRQGVFAERVQVDLNKEIMARLRKNNPAFDAGEFVQVNKSVDGNGLLVFKNPLDMNTDQGVAAMRAAQKIARDQLEAGVPDSFESLVRNNLAEHGYDGVIYHGGELYEPLFPDTIKIVDPEVNPETGIFGQKLRKTKFETNDELANHVYITREIEANLSGDNLRKDPELMASIAMRFGTNPDPNTVEKFAKVYLSGEVDDLSKVRVQRSEGIVGVGQEGDNIVIDIPNKVETVQDHRNFISELVEGLQDLVTKGEGTGKAVVDMNKIYESYFQKYTLPNMGSADQVAFLSDALEKGEFGSIRKTGDTFELSVGKGEKIQVDNLEDLVDQVLLQSVDDTTLSVHLKNLGYKMSRSKEGQYYVYGKGKEPLYTGASKVELLNNMNYRPEKLPESLLPPTITLDEDAVRVTYTDGVMRGNTKNIRQLLDKFGNTQFSAKLQKRLSNKMGDVFLQPSGNYQIHVPKAGIHESYRSLDEAKEALNNWHGLPYLQKHARRKGLHFAIENNEYVFYDASGGRYAANTVEDLEKIFRQFPDFHAGPNIVGDGLEDAADLLAGKISKDPNMAGMRPNTFFALPQAPLKTTEEIKEFGHVRGTVIGNMDEFMYQLQKKMDDPDIYKLFKDVETANRLSTTIINEGNTVIEEIFTTRGKLGRYKFLSPRQREGIWRARQLRADPEKYQKVIDDYDLADIGLEERLTKIDNLLGTDPGKGLFALYITNPAKFVDDYMSRIRRIAYQGNYKLDTMNWKDFTEKAFKERGGMLPKEFDFFAENERMSDVLELAEEKDALKVLKIYHQKAVRKFYLNDPLRRMYQHMDAKYKHVTDANNCPVMARLHHYRDLLMGTYTTMGERKVREWAENMARKLGATDPATIKAHGDIVHKMFSLNYLTNMGLRPWLPIRNMFQVYTTLGVRFGHTEVMKAFKQLADDKFEQIEYLRRVGVITGKAPLINSISDVDSAITGLTRRFLKWFKNSDEITRGVGYLTVKNLWDDGLDKWKKGLFDNEDQFIRYVGLNKMDKPVREQVMDLFHKRYYDGALDRYANQAVEDAFFGYRRSNSPMYAHSLFGRFFGQYGTYSAGYRSNLSKMWRNTSGLERAAMLARLGLTGTAIWGAFRAIGIEEKNFLPFLPGLFGGGPLFYTGLDVIRSFGSGYQAQQSRHNIQRAFSPVKFDKLIKDGKFEVQYPNFFPGSHQYRSLKKFNELLDKGDSYGAWVTVTGFPYDPDSRNW